MRWNRGTWDYEISDGWNAGDAVDVTITPNHVLFAVTQEQAVDSYNQTFTCSIEVPYENVAGLYAVLGEALAKRGASADRSPKGEKPQALSAKHESAVPSEASADAPPPAPSLQTPQGGDS